MSLVKKTLKFLYILPNYPFYIIVAIFVAYKIYKETGLVEMTLVDPKDVVTEDIKTFIENNYPKHLGHGIAIFFYATLIIYMFK